MAGTIEIPEKLKSELPPSQWGKVLGATPIVMTVIATLLAGLASSEMTRAQYDRSLAAQLQAKAGDQWGYAAAKKTRGALAHNSLDLLAATAEVHPLDAGVLRGDDATIIAALTKGELPAVPRLKLDAEIQSALEAVGNFAPENEIATRLEKVKAAGLAAGTLLLPEVRRGYRFDPERQVAYLGRDSSIALEAATESPAQHLLVEQPSWRNVFVRLRRVR